MNIQIDGAGSANKGAQLMLFSVLDSIEKKHPGANVLINNADVNLDLFVRFTKISIKIVEPNLLQRIVSSAHIYRFFKYFLPPVSYYFTKYKADKNVDMILDAGGFQFGDAWEQKKYDVNKWKHYLKKSQSNKTVTVFLPQAFGPFTRNGARNLGKVIIDGASHVMARDIVSYEYLKELRPLAKNISLYPDFTSLMSGQETKISRDCKGKVCLIPNSKMISQGVISESDFLKVFCTYVSVIVREGFNVFLLNHEGTKDLELCNKIAENFKDYKIPIYTGLNALETKGIIASSYLVISSRYHGVANALNSGVPCLATSWSHKYKMLMEDYGQFDKILDVADMVTSRAKILNLLNVGNNSEARLIIEKNKKEVVKKTELMWEKIWSLQRTF